MVFVNNTFSTCTRVGMGADSWLVDSRGPGVKGWGCHPPTPGKMASAMMPSSRNVYPGKGRSGIWAAETVKPSPTPQYLPADATRLPADVCTCTGLYYPDEILHFVPFFPITVDKGMFTRSHNYHYSWATGEPGCNEGFFEHTCSFYYVYPGLTPPGWVYHRIHRS